MRNKKAEGPIQWVTSLILITLFGIAIIGFGVKMATDSDSTINIGNDPNITLLTTQMEGTADVFVSDSESTEQSILNSTIAPGSTTTTGVGQYVVPNANIIRGMSNIATMGKMKLFGDSPEFGIFFTTFMGIILVITILYSVKWWRTGLPD